MSKAKVPLQVYLSRDDREYYVEMHERNETNASQELREFIKRKIKVDKKKRGIA